MKKDNNIINYLPHNQHAWDNQALAQNEWSRPVSAEAIALAKEGQWEVHLTPKALNKEWLGDIIGKKILCLASAGGQQAPTLAAAGAEVTVFDISEQQLEQDRIVAERDNLQLTTVQGSMTDLSVFNDESFDLIFHPISNHYIPNVLPMWKECYRVLKRGGLLLASFYNPILFVGDRNPQYMEQGVIRPSYKIPYSDIKDLSTEDINNKQASGEAFTFGHSLTDLIGGQLNVGFSMLNFDEDYQPRPRFLIDNYLPTFIATRAIKV